MTVFCLGVHADYRCRNSGVCCSSGWEIPVTLDAERAIRGGVDSGLLRVEARGVPLFRSRRELPDGARVVFGVDGASRCAFFEPQGRLCAVHRQVGPAALPPSCRQFPRIALLTPVGIFIALSHYCPTAADLLFRDGRPDDIVAEPPAFPAGEPWEGLDAREAWPPLLRPGVLLGWDGFVRWQRDGVALLLREDLAPEAALATLVARAERAAAWTPEAGPLVDRLTALAAETAVDTAPVDVARALAAWRAVAATVPESLRQKPPPLGPGPEPAEAAVAHARFVTPAWQSLATPVRRYLAAKLFASWAALQGDGLVAWTREVATALDVLQVEAARRCAETGAPLDTDALRAAIRRADLLLVHLSRTRPLS